MDIAERKFDIKDTWIFMGLLAQREESELTKYIQNLRRKEKLSSQEVAAAEYAAEMRSTLKETKEICSQKALQEKNGQYEIEALQKLLKWGVISEDESKVMALRVNHTYREIGTELGIATSTAYNTVERVHERVKMLYRKVSKIETNDTSKIEANAKKIQEKVIESKLSDQQVEIYRLMCKGYCDLEIRLKLNLTPGNYRYQKCQINKKKKFIDIV